jgi:hypothetical protein
MAVTLAFSFWLGCRLRSRSRARRCTERQLFSQCVLWVGARSAKRRFPIKVNIRVPPYGEPWPYDEMLAGPTWLKRRDDRGSEQSLCLHRAPNPKDAISSGAVCGAERATKALLTAAGRAALLGNRATTPHLGQRFASWAACWPALRPGGLAGALREGPARPRHCLHLSRHLAGLPHLMSLVSKV